jgi:SAM-dependent methyltransferase
LHSILSNDQLATGPTGQAGLTVSFKTHRHARPWYNWGLARRLIGAWLRDPRQFSGDRRPRLCPICGHDGVMVDAGPPPRWDARCAGCGSLERHRLLWLWATRERISRLAGRRVLHIVPDRALRGMLRDNPAYDTADWRRRDVTYRAHLTRLPVAQESYDVVIASHVLQRIDDDSQAMRELFRVLRPGGLALLTVPINPTRTITYEDPTITRPADRQAHFNGPDHWRFYGLDFADRLRDVGFSVDTFRMTPAEEVTFGLLPTEWLYVATRPIDVE